ncbi:hypothetical protein BC830DRAFT_1153355 [Chytriomyces sp. MP71]|nr:hypothetical protein BC830DRAFT_1153355 [Chytriomyces sp. MP71]
MGRSEFASPPVKILVDSDAAFIQCAESVTDCRCGSGTEPAKRNGFMATERSGPSDKELSAAVVAGSVSIAFEPGNDVGAIVAGQGEEPLHLEIRLFGREHIDLAAATSPTSPTTPVSTKTFIHYVQKLPWQPWAWDTSADAAAKPKKYDPSNLEATRVYPFQFMLPMWAPPSAIPQQGAVDYRIEARFVVPTGGDSSSKHAHHYDELVAQKRIQVVRQHLNFSGLSLVPGPLVPQKPHFLPFSANQPQHFALEMWSPTYAYLNNGHLECQLRVTPRGTPGIDLRNLTSITLKLQEVVRYAHARVREDGKTVLGVKAEMTTLGKCSVADPALLHVPGQPPLSLQVAYGNGIAGLDGIPVVMHPAFSAEKMFVSHVLLVRVTYDEFPVEATQNVGSFVGFFKKLSKAVVPAGLEEDYTVPIIIRVGTHV